MLGSKPDDEPIGRQTPAHGVLPTLDGATILWCTVCAEDRGNWCADATVMSCLHAIWQNDAAAWLVGDYLLMPDHLHFFCTPGPNQHVEVELWTKYWKGRFRRLCGQPLWYWQRGIFHHRVRSEDAYVEKGRYMLNNPVRKGLVRDSDEWPWKGRVHTIRW